MTKTMKHLRERTGNSLDDFAKIAGVSSRTLYRIEHEGGQAVRPYMYYRVINAISTSLGEKIDPDTIEEPTKAQGTVDKAEQA